MGRAQACEDRALLHSIRQAHSGLLETTARIDAWHATQHWQFPRLGLMEPDSLRKLMALSETDYQGLQPFLPLLFSGATASGLAQTPGFGLESMVPDRFGRW